MNGATRDAAGESTKRGVWTNHGLHRKAKGLQRILFGKRDSFEVLQQRWTVIPRHAIAAVDDVVALKRADRHALHAGNSQLSRERQKIALQLAEDILAILSQIHLVHGGEHVGNSQERSDEGVTPRLRKEPFCSVNENDRQVRRGGSRRHVPAVVKRSSSVFRCCTKKSEKTLCGLFFTEEIIRNSPPAS